MKKRGFTLIELLAVIVVLAIIALIATPIVMNTIKNSKKGAAERGADNYIKQVETTIAEKRLENTPLSDGTYTIDENGNLTGNGLTEPITIEMNGTKPSSGSITISNGEVTTSSIIGFKDYEVKYNTTNKKYEATAKNNSSSDISTVVCDLQEGKSQKIGSKYTCHLDSDRMFYVLETSEDKVSLIMDRNFTDNTVAKTLAWCIDGGSDNTTCKNITSKEEGTPLKHIQNTFGTSVEVSIPSKDQIENSYTGSMPTWLYDYLDGTTNSVSGVYGYWTSTPIAPYSDSACYVFLDSTLGYATVDGGNLYGIRPVITISKSQLG